MGGAKNTVMVVNQDTGDRNPNSEAWGVFPVVTVTFPSVVPLIADVLDAISEGKIFSKMDMTQGFRQLKLAEESMHKTAFSCY